MKLVSLVFIVVGFALPSYAVKEIGNGGHVWVCFKSCTREIQKIESIDLIEAIGKGKLRTQPLKVIDFSKPGERSFYILKHFADKLTLDSPWFLGDIVNPHINKVLKIIHFSAMPLPFTHDLVYIENGIIGRWPQIKPDCDGDLEIRQAAIYYPDKDVLIVDSVIWDSPKFSEFNKFVLLLHESMYSLARALYPHPPELMSSHTAGLWVAQLLYDQSIQAKINFFDSVVDQP